MTSDSQIHPSSHGPHQYTLQQFDDRGEKLSETAVTAASCSAAFRELRDVSEGAERIVVLNQDGTNVGESTVDFWRVKCRRK